MKAWAVRIVVTLVLAAIIHVLAVLEIPYLVSGVLERNILKSTAINTFKHDHPRSAGPENRIPQSNPDFLPSILVYDVSQKPLHIHLAVPEGVPYWSFSLFASNLDNYYVFNDRNPKLGKPADGVRQADLVLTGPETPYKAAGSEIVVESPSARGVGLIRMIVEDRYSEAGKKEVEKLKKVQRMSFAEPVKVN